MPNHRPGADDGCRFIEDNGMACGAERREGSSYCAEHHARCYLTPAEAEIRQREYEALARASAGKWAPTKWRYSGHGPEDLERIERLVR